MPEGHRRLPTTASLRALVRELAVLWWLSCVKETQAKKRNMLIVPSTTSRNYIDINWWEGHIHNLQRHRLPQTCPESSGAWLNTSRAEVFHSILSNYNMRFTFHKNTRLSSPTPQHVVHSNTFEINLLTQSNVHALHLQLSLFTAGDSTVHHTGALRWTVQVSMLLNLTSPVPRERKKPTASGKYQAVWREWR